MPKNFLHHPHAFSHKIIFVCYCVGLFVRLPLENTCLLKIKQNKWWIKVRYCPTCCPNLWRSLTNKEYYLICMLIIFVVGTQKHLNQWFLSFLAPLPPFVEGQYSKALLFICTSGTSVVMKINKILIWPQFIRCSYLYFSAFKHFN